MQSDAASVSAVRAGSAETGGLRAVTGGAAAIAAFYVLAHLPFLAPSLEDIDSINFALGLHDYDVAQHRPHPPGYPVYIALGRATLTAATLLGWPSDVIERDAFALAVWSVIGAAAALIAAAVFFRVLGSVDMPAPSESGSDAQRSPAERTAHYAIALLAVCPLFWMTGLRPMSDMPGLAIALTAQALLVRGLVDRRPLAIGAFVAGLGIGVRSQTIWLTVPLGVFVLVSRHRSGRGASLGAVVTGFIVGIAIWAIPLVALSGGVDGFLRALGSQAGEDFAWVSMLWAEPTPRKLAFTLYETLVVPWVAVWLAVLVGLSASAGALVMLRRARRALWLLTVAFAPYVVFHLLFQETVTARYALPVVPPIAYLAMRAVMALGARAAFVCVPVVAASLWVAVPGAIAYGAAPHPAFRAIADMTAEARRAAPGEVFAHFGVWRPLQAAATALPLNAPPRTYEWLRMTDYWQRGGRAVVWFVADPRRTDLALIDPESLTDRTRYHWQAESRAELAGTRPVGVDWYRIAPPAWYATEGWSLTPETGGIVRSTKAGLNHRPIEAFVRRRSEPMHMIIGGRDLGGVRDPATSYELTLDGVMAATWLFDPAVEGQNFLRVIPLPQGIPSGPGDYARLRVAGRAVAPGAAIPEVAIRQFNLQPDTGVMVGFAAGWHEEEYENATGRRWRWTSDRSVLQIVPPQAVTLMLRGESPMKYFDQPPTVRVRTGSRVQLESRPDSDFQWQVAVSADDLRSAHGEITIDIDRVYLPGDAEGTSDVRRLGLRMFEVRVEQRRSN